jgi:t-SNARE complex subunit (syntaxin)
VEGKFVTAGDTRTDVREIRQNIRSAIHDINAPLREHQRLLRERDAAEAAARRAHIAAIAAALEWDTFQRPEEYP